MPGIVAPGLSLTGGGMVDSASLATLADLLGEGLILPNSPDYEEARRVWNGMIDRRPAAIASCRNVDHVVGCVRAAAAQQWLVAVRGGGHNVAGFATCDGGIVIDLSSMKRVQVDPNARLATVEAGATWADVDRATQPFGLAVPGGIVSTTGVAGLTLGGGQGWLRRTYGMTCDSLTAADIVTARGERVIASETENDDLFWAIRGGGGNFGIVTEFTFRLHPAGPVVAFAAPVYDLDAAPGVLAGFRDFVAGAPDEVNATFTLWTVPPGSGFPPSTHGRDVLIVSAIYVGPPEEGEHVLQPVRRLGDPVADLSSQIPYAALQQLFDPFFPKGELRYYWKALYLDDLGSDAIDTLLAAARNRPSSASMIAVWALGGAMARVDAARTAVGSRHAPYVAEILANWKDAADTSANLAWARELFGALHRFSSGKPNVNFPGLFEESASLVRAAFGSDYERLLAVKGKYDPENLFRLNHNIV